jgi:hypothetical protein
MEETIMRLAPFISCTCCGGPVLVLFLTLVSFGILFMLLSAVALGWVFVGIGIATFGLCMLLASEVAGARYAIRLKLAIPSGTPVPPGGGRPPGDRCSLEPIGQLQPCS